VHAVVEAAALALVDRAELPLELELVEARLAARRAQRSESVGRGDADAIVRADLLGLEHLDERAEALRERALLAAHRSRVVDHEQDVDRAPQLQLDGTCARGRIALDDDAGRLGRARRRPPGTVADLGALGIVTDVVGRTDPHRRAPACGPDEPQHDQRSTDTHHHRTSTPDFGA